MNSAYTVIGAGFALGILVATSTVIVNEQQQALLFRQDPASASRLAPGLHIKWPLLDHVKLFDTWVVNLETPSEALQTADHKTVMVDGFAQWQIQDAALYQQQLGGDELKADAQLKQLISATLSQEVAQHSLEQLVSEQRQTVDQAVLNKLQAQTRQWGLALVDWRMRQIDLPESLEQALAQQMRIAYEQAAQHQRSETAELVERIRNTADQKKQATLGDAQREAQHLRGEGDAQSLALASKSYGKNAEFFAYYRSLQVFQNAFEKGQDTLVLKPDAELFKQFVTQP